MANPTVSGTTTATPKKMQRHFIGRAWINKTQNGEFINCVLDKKKDAPIILNGINDECVFQLFPNKKREGKKDADYRLSLLIPEE